MKIDLQLETFIKPKHEIEISKTPHYLTPNELAPLSIDPMQKGLLFSLPHSNNNNNNYYNNHITQTISHLVDRLKKSLAIALVHFYPLAGRFTTLKYPEENSCSILLDYTKGTGARFIHASALDFSISDIISSNNDGPKIVRSFFELGEKSFNFDGHTSALLTVQVTELQDGVFIGFTLNHCIADGTSLLHFITMLNEIFTSYEDNVISNNSSNTQSINNITREPIFFYNPMKNSGDFINNVVYKLPYLDPEMVMPRGYDPGPLRERIFHISAPCLASLKAKANKECGTHNNVISSFQALIALVWRCITRARKQLPDQTTGCALLVDARTRFDPPISQDYFGNFLSVAKGVCTVEELMGHDLGWAAMVLHKAVKAQDTKVVTDFYKKMFEKPMILPRDTREFKEVVVGGSPRFDIYGAEFGLGRALAVRTGGFANKSDAKVTASIGCEGIGSVMLEICLRPHTMDALENDSEFMSLVS